MIIIYYVMSYRLWLSALFYDIHPSARLFSGQMSYENLFFRILYSIKRCFPPKCSMDLLFRHFHTTFERKTALKSFHIIPMSYEIQISQISYSITLVLFYYRSYPFTLFPAYLRRLALEEVNQLIPLKTSVSEYD